MSKRKSTTVKELKAHGDTLKRRKSLNATAKPTTTGRTSAKAKNTSNTPKTARKKTVTETTNVAQLHPLGNTAMLFPAHPSDLAMPVQFGRVKATIYGGPFRKYVSGQRRLVSVKMAEEIDMACDINVPTRDFDVPPMSAMHAGIALGLQAIIDGNDLYVGCMGGTGRTGLYMACLAKVMRDYAPGTNALDLTEQDVREARTDSYPVAYVRKHYKPHAVEMPSQEKFVEDFDTTKHVQWLKAMLEPKVVEVPVEKVVTHTVEVVKEVPVYHFNPFMAAAQWLGAFRK